jgi:hypothetical protein
MVASDYKIAATRYNDLSNNIDLTSQLDEASKQYTKEYTLFIIWLIITILLVILTMVTVIYHTEINPLVWMITILFIAYCSFFIFKNIYYLYGS